MLDGIRKIKRPFMEKKKQAQEEQILIQVNNRLPETHQFDTITDYRKFIERCLSNVKKNAILKNKAYYEHQLKLLAHKSQLDKYNALLQDFYYNNLQYIKGM